MFLAIDAGNSNIVFGFYENEAWLHEFRIETKPTPTPREMEMKLRLFLLENNLKISQVDEIALCSVVPALNETITQTVENLFGVKVILINDKLYPGLLVSTTNPSEIGTDLMANAVAAYEQYQGACIIVDFGTALTFTAVDNDGSILGVNIVPGIETAIQSLAAHTAQLPEIKLEMPSVVIGTNTVESIQAGILLGYTGLVERMIQRIQATVSYDFKVIATGGLSSILTPLQATFDDIDAKLTLKGIKFIAKVATQHKAETGQG